MYGILDYKVRKTDKGMWQTRCIPARRLDAGLFPLELASYLDGLLELGVFTLFERIA
jgi:hypothetical protein